MNVYPCRAWLIAAGIAYALFFASSPETRAQSKPSPINLPGQIGERLAQCWEAPRTDPPQAVEVTVRLSFSRSGAVIGAPRIAYIYAPDVAGLKDKIKESFLAAIKACTPLPFTPALGAAIAGRILAIRIRSLPFTGRPRFAVSGDRI